jgi:VWFA-related protein
MTFVMARYLRALEWCRGLPKLPSMASLSHRQGWSLAVILTIFPCFLFSGSGSGGNNPQITYHTGTSEVRVSFFATDQDGRLMGTLTKEDFAVVDSGVVIREFRSLARSNETALHVVALVDTSASVAPRFRANMQHVLQLLDRETSNSSEVVSVVQFAGLQPTLLCSRDCRSAGAQQKLAVTKAEGPTPLFDALTYTAEFVSRGRAPGVRQVVILFSDGNDTISRASATEAFDAILSSGALLYTVNLDASRDVSPGSLVLQQMADATGGRSFFARDGIANVLQAILADLRAAYVVSYALPTRQPGFHFLRILPKHNLNLRFHCRRGYFYEETR